MIYLLVGLPLLIPEESLAKSREFVDVHGSISAQFKLIFHTDF